jgi:hypothetical protein
VINLRQSLDLLIVKGMHHSKLLSNFWDVGIRATVGKGAMVDVAKVILSHLFGSFIQ